MQLPELTQPDRYRGLYVFDFGDWTAVGYTAEEIALLLESEQYRGGRVYKIVRAAPDGQMDLKGVAPQRFQLESGLFFSRADLAAAEADFAALRALAAEGAPCRAFLQLADRGAAGGTDRGIAAADNGRGGAAARYVTALIYPAEYEDEVAAWLREAEYLGGDTAEGGPSHVTNYYHDSKVILERAQLWSRATLSRSRDEVLATVRRAVQR